MEMWEAVLIKVVKQLGGWKRAFLFMGTLTQSIISSIQYIIFLCFVLGEMWVC